MHVPHGTLLAVIATMKKIHPRRSRRQRGRKKTVRTRTPTTRTELHSLILEFLDMSDAKKNAYLAKLTAEEKHHIVTRYRRFWALQQAGRLDIHATDFAEQKANAGTFSVRVTSEIAKKLQHKVADDLGFVFVSGRRGESFLRQKEGVGKWVKADALEWWDYLQKVKRTRRRYLYDQVCEDGKIRSKEKDLQVSKEEQKSEAPRRPTPLTTLEVQFPPMVQRMIVFLREDMLAAGKTEAEFEEAALALVHELIAILVDYLEWRTGQLVTNVFTHYDSGLFHVGFYLTRVDENLRMIGVTQLGTSSPVNVGWNSELACGYTLVPELWAKYRQRMLLMGDRYRPEGPQGMAALERGAHYDGRAVDIGLSEEVMAFFFKKDAEMGWGYWDRGCAVYRAWLEETEPDRVGKRSERRMLKKQVQRALLTKGQQVKLEAEEMRLATMKKQVQGALEKGLAASGLEGVEFREGMRKVTSEFSLERIAKAVIDPGIPVWLIELWEAAKEGVLALLKFLRGLFRTEDSLEAAGSLPVDAAVTEKRVVPAVVAPPTPAPPIVRVLSITDDEVVSLREVKTAVATYSAAPIGPEFRLVIANWERGVWGGSGLSRDQLEAFAEQRDGLRTWVAAQEQLRLAAVPKASVPTSTLAPPETPEAAGVEVSREHEPDEASPDVAKPEDQREKAMYDQVRAWLGQRWDHPAPSREQAIAERCWYVTRRWANGDLKQVRQEPASPGSKSLRSTATHTVTVSGEKNLRELMETAPFLESQLVLTRCHPDPEAVQLNRIRPESEKVKRANVYITKKRRQRRYVASSFVELIQLLEHPRPRHCWQLIQTKVTTEGEEGV